MSGNRKRPRDNSGQNNWNWGPNSWMDPYGNLGPPWNQPQVHHTYGYGAFAYGSGGRGGWRGRGGYHGHQNQHLQGFQSDFSPPFSHLQHNPAKRSKRDHQDQVTASVPTSNGSASAGQPPASVSPPTAVTSPSATSSRGTSASSVVPSDPAGANHGERIRAFRGLFAKLANWKEVDDKTVGSGDMPDVSRAIWQNFSKRVDTQASFTSKIELWMNINEAIFKYCGRDFRTHVFGSTLSGFGSRRSDVDLCIVSPFGIKKAAERLAEIRRYLKRYFRGVVSNNIELIHAKVPILKFSYNEFDVDLSYNNTLGTRNTHLLFCYSQCDWRVRPLVFAVKSWAKRHHINDAKTGSLSSYALSLLMINYLQIERPPVVPVLHDLYPGLFIPPPGDDAGAFTLPFLRPLDKFTSANKMSLADLFAGFMRHYNEFDFTSDVASVRTGSVLSNASCHAHAKSIQVGPGQWKAYVCVEEPFERSNAARATCKRDSFDDILYAISSTDGYGRRKEKKLFSDY